MKNRLHSGLVGRARRGLLVSVPALGLAMAMVGVVPAQQAFAQESSGGSINIGGSIAATVADAVSGIDTNSDSGTVFGGIQLESNSADLGDDEGTAISDASGGNYNVSEKSGSRHGG
jgi:hypothetical protein